MSFENSSDHFYLVYKGTFREIFKCFKGKVCLFMEKEMVIQSSVLAWRIQGAEEPGGLPSMGLSDLAAAAAAYLFRLMSWYLQTNNPTEVVISDFY